MASLEKLKEKLKALTEKSKEINAKIKALQAEIEKRESQEVINTLRELNLSPKQAREMLLKAKSTAAREAGEISRQEYDGEGKGSD